MAFFNIYIYLHKEEAFMNTLLVLMILFTLFSLNLYFLSKGAEARKNARGTLFEQDNESFTQEDATEFPPLSYETNESDIRGIDYPMYEDIVFDESLVEAPQYVEESLVPDELEEVDLDTNAVAFLNKIGYEEVDNLEHENDVEEYVQDELFEIDSSIPTELFPEVDLQLVDNPIRGYYYIAGRIQEKFDDFLVLVSDGTKERVFDHNKFDEYEENELFIGQVIIEDGHWYLNKIWKPIVHNEDEEDIEKVS